VVGKGGREELKKNLRGLFKEKLGGWGPWTPSLHLATCLIIVIKIHIMKWKGSYSNLKWLRALTTFSLNIEKKNS
jgi:hypothetical protein